MKASKKFLSLLLVLAMVFSFAAVSASADDIVGNVVTSGDVEQPADVTTDTQPEANKPEDTQSEEQKPEEPKVEEPKVEQPKEEISDPVAVIVGSEKTYKYASLAEAIDAAASDATIQVEKDITLSAPLTITKNVKIELAEATITFANSGALYDAALVVNKGASVTIRNGEISFVKSVDKDGNPVGFKNGLVVEDGALKLRDVDVNGTVAGGAKLSKVDGSINIMGGEFDFDPSAYVAEGYEAKEADGVFTVAVRPAQEAEENSEDGQAQEAEQKPLKAPAAPADTDADNSTDENQDGDTDTDENEQNGGTVVVPDNVSPFRLDPDDEGKTTLTEDSSEDVTADGKTWIDLGGNTLSGKVTVPAEGMLQLENGTVSGDIENNGQLRLADNLIVTGKIVSSGMLNLTDRLTVNDIELKAGTIDIDSENVTVNGTITAAAGVTGEITGGTFKNKPDEKFIPEGYEIKEVSGSFTVVKEDSTPVTPTEPTVTDAKGNAYNDENNYLEYIKGRTAVNPGEGLVFIDQAKFLMNQKPKKVMLNSTELTENTDYTWNDESKTLEFSFKNDSGLITSQKFEDLPAGQNKIVFEFAGGKVELPMLVMPEMIVENPKYVIGSQNGFTFKLTDKPEFVTFNIGTNGANARIDGKWTYDAAAETLTVKSEFMDTLAAGSKTLGVWYPNGTNAKGEQQYATLMYNITVRPAPTIAPVDANKDNKWLNSSSALSYNVSPNVKSVTVDGSAVDAKNYSVSDKNVLSLKSAYLKTLAYGKHTLKVETEDGNVSVEFTTAPSLVAKSGSNHTKGGQKDLTFVASDAMNAVYVGSTRLKSDYYTISTDGKTITLKASFLNTLKADNTYTITVANLNADGNTARYSAATTFKILSAATAGSTPKTGDTGITLWVALLTLSGAAMAVIIPKRRKG